MAMMTMMTMMMMMMMMIKLLNDNDSKIISICLQSINVAFLGCERFTDVLSSFKLAGTMLGEILSGIILVIEYILIHLIITENDDM